MADSKAAKQKGRKEGRREMSQKERIAEILVNFARLTRSKARYIANIIVETKGGK